MAETAAPSTGSSMAHMDEEQTESESEEEFEAWKLRNNKSSQKSASEDYCNADKAHQDKMDVDDDSEKTQEFPSSSEKQVMPSKSAIEQLDSEDSDLDELPISQLRIRNCHQATDSDHSVDGNKNPQENHTDPSTFSGDDDMSPEEPSKSSSSETSDSDGHLKPPAKDTKDPSSESDEEKSSSDESLPVGHNKNLHESKSSFGDDATSTSEDSNQDPAKVSPEESKYSSSDEEEADPTGEDPSSENQDEHAEDDGRNSAESAQPTTLETREYDPKRRKTEDGYFLPRTTPRQKEDGTFARPCGRAPPGMVWDATRGVYAPESKTKDRQHKGKSTRNKSPNKLVRQQKGKSPTKSLVVLPTKAVSTNGQRGHSPKSSNSKRKSLQERQADFERRMTDNGCIRPVVLKPAGNGTYARPRGRSPMGMVWDARKGLYVPERQTKKRVTSFKSSKRSGTSTAVSRRAKRAGEGISANPSQSNDTGQASGMHKRPKRKRNSDGTSSPSSAITVKARTRAKAVSKPAASYPHAASLSKSTASSPSKAPPKRGYEIGSLVYAEWPKNEEWYPATITAIKRKADSHFDRYSLRFEDGSGDVIDFASQNSFITATRYRELYGTELTLLSTGPSAKGGKKRHKSSAATATSASMVSAEQKRPGSFSLGELYARRCKKCTNCTKEDCGRCASCMSNRSNSRRQVCIQKMCCEIPREKKAQLVPQSANFPDGWTFVINPEMPGYYPETAKIKPRALDGVSGLKLFPPSPGKRTHGYYSVEGALSHNPKALADASPQHFYQFIGAISGLSLAKVASQGSQICGACENCTKEACGQCAACMSSRSGTSQNCFQKMCFETPIEAKMEDAVGFPQGWRFYFAEAHTPNGSGRNGYETIPTLWILSPRGKIFRSVEAATSFYRLAGGDRIKNEFYNHVGLSSKAGIEYGSDGGGKSATQQRAVPSRSLSKDRVEGARVYCATKNQWGIIRGKFQLGKGKFQYSVRLEDDNTLIEGLDDASVLSEVCFKNKTGRDPPPPPPVRRESEYDSDDDSPETLSGCQMETDSVYKIRTTTDNFIVGRQVRFLWNDLKRNQKVVYGKVTECEVDPCTGDTLRCKVVYNDTSREAVNSMKNGSGLTVPEAQWLEPKLVIGGCIGFEEGNQVEVPLSDYSSPPFHWTWVFPEMHHETIVDGYPRLTLVVRGFRLDLKVKDSKIAGAGKGVFLSCTRLIDGNDSDDEDEALELGAGELIDTGAYAPYGIEDKKSEAEFYVKNVIHSYTPEEWSFGQKDSPHVLDITDDVTGDLHLEAKSHIYAYVNETTDENVVTIRAEHDAEGAVHYLLGHADEAQGKFVVPCDGDEVEVLVCYGPWYEKVRVRKGYSSDGNADIWDRDGEDMTAVMKMMDNFGEAEVEAAVCSLFKLFSTKNASEFSEAVINRAVMCAAVLQRRAQLLFWKANDDVSTEEPSSVNLREVLKVSRGLVSMLLKMADDEQDELKALHSDGNVRGLRKEILERQYSAETLGELVGTVL